MAHGHDALGLGGGEGGGGGGGGHGGDVEVEFQEGLGRLAAFDGGFEAGEEGESGVGRGAGVRAKRAVLVEKIEQPILK